MTVVKGKHPHPFRRPLIVAGLKRPTLSTNSPADESKHRRSEELEEDEELRSLEASIAAGLRYQFGLIDESGPLDSAEAKSSSGSAQGNATDEKAE